MKVCIIGGGGLVGSSAAFALQAGGVVREIALADVNRELAEELQAQLTRMAALRGEEEQVLDRVRKALAIGLSLLEDNKKGS